MIRRPTFFAFETARRAIANAQFGLDTVGHNMSNINTPGYTRQRVDQVSWTVSGTSKYQINNSYFAGMGSQVIGISQMRDPFLDARYRSEGANYGELAVKQGGYIDLENIFDEVMSDALHDGLQNLVSALEDAQKNPTDEVYFTTVKNESEKFAQMLYKYAGELDNVRTQQTEDLKYAVEDEVNIMLKQIADLNEKITEVEVYGNPANDLRDSRNLLLDQLSGYVDIKIEETKKQITPDISITSLKVVLKDNPSIALVDKDKYGSLAMSKDPVTGVVEIEVTDTIGATHTDDELTKGGLRGYLDIINGDGSDPTTKGIAYCQNYIDKLASVFAKTMNDINTQNGGTVPLFVNSTDGTTTGITAANISISSDWRSDPKAIVLSHPDSLANPIEAMRFIDALTKKTYGTATGDLICPDLPDMTLEQIIDGFQGIIGLEKSSVDKLFDSSRKVISTLDDQRQSISGVSENEEAISMMTYSNYYNAALRYMTTLDEALDSVIHKMGLVGR